MQKTYQAVAMSHLLCASSIAADIPAQLNCRVQGTDDLFLLYPEQVSHAGKHFFHYQLIDGLTIVVVNLQTGRFNRLSNLNLLPHSTVDPRQPADPQQFFSGVCEGL